MLFSAQTHFTTLPFSYLLSNLLLPCHVPTPAGTKNLFTASTGVFQAQRGPIACMPLPMHLHWMDSSSDTHHLTMVAKASSVFLFLEKETCTVLNILIYLAEAMELSVNHLTGFIYVQPHDLAVMNWTWWETALEADVTQLSQRLCYPVQCEELNKQTDREKVNKDYETS